MKVQKTIPEKNTNITVLFISVNLEDRVAKVVYKISGRKESTVVNLIPIYSPGTTSQKNTIKAFFRQIVAEGLNVDIGDIPDIFN